MSVTFNEAALTGPPCISLCVQAALVRLTDLDPDVPTIAFLITDAPPHLQSHRPQTDTYRAEVRAVRPACCRAAV